MDRKTIQTSATVLAALLLLISLLSSMAAAASPAQPMLAPIVRSLLADHSGLEVSEPAGTPPVGMVTGPDGIAAWYGSSHALLDTIGYSGAPIDVLVVVGTDGHIMAAHLIDQNEPILTLGISPGDLSEYVSSFNGADLSQSISRLEEQGAIPDAVSGATVSSGVIRDAILRTGRLLLAADKRVSTIPARVSEKFPDWTKLTSAGKVYTRTITFADIRKALPGTVTLPQGDGVFCEFSVIPLDDPVTIAALLGTVEYGRLSTRFSSDARLVLIAARGIYSVKGTDWRKTGHFDRLAIVAGNRRLTLASENHQRIDKLRTADSPEFREIFVTALPAELADAPFEIRLVVDKTGEGERAAVEFPLALGVNPAALASPQHGEPLWSEAWRKAAPDLVILGLMLTILFVALYISGPIVRRPGLHAWFRNGFLCFTLIWLGWLMGAQLSVVQVIAFSQSLLTGFRWDIFLMAPLVFVLWSFVALGTLFWGRGVYCGWLCPFGALQELTHKTGQYFGLRRIEIPWEIHERLWPLKYIVLLAIAGLSLQDKNTAFAAAEIEPFKTAIILHFLRDWPFVTYALALVAASLFVERAYCRYLCPLGASLAIPSKFKIFDWLIRRPQCGRECRLCATTCTVQAIDPIGRINPNECIYCLQCQVNYHDQNTCVPLKMRARRGENPATTTGRKGE